MISFTLAYIDVEKLAYKNASLVIGVTHKMIHHINNKYGQEKKNLVIPIMQNLVELQQKDFAVEKMTIVYAGGTHKWQQFEKMLEFVNTNNGRYNFIFLVPDIKFVNDLYSNLYKTHFPGILKSVSPDEVKEYYKISHFGLVLREDNIVNQVASPTKLMEYMMYGVLPVVDFDGVGDFKEFGYHNISYLKMDNLQDIDLKEKIRENYEIIKKMSLTYNDNLKLLRKFLG